MEIHKTGCEIQEILWGGTLQEVENPLIEKARVTILNLLLFSNVIRIRKMIGKMWLSDKMPNIIEELVEIVDHAFLVTVICTFSVLNLSSSAKQPGFKSRGGNTDR